MLDAADARFMSRALELARRGWYSARPNPRVGCVIVRDGRVLGEGFHARAGGPHAETVALASVSAAGENAVGATAYVTLEPCAHHGRTPPCADALVAARVARVVYGHVDPHARVAGGGLARLAAHGVAVEGPLLEDEARALNPGFISRMVRERPRVTAKVAMSLDARIALADGSSQWITGPAARADGQRLRAESGAIVTGAGTVAADDPALTVRDPRFAAQLPAPPLRVVMDRRLSALGPGRALADTATAPTVVFTAEGQGPAAAALEATGVEVATVKRVTPGVVLGALAAREINDVLVEAGPGLMAAFLEADVVDCLVVYVASCLLGRDAVAAFDLASPGDLEGRLGFELADTRRVGADTRLTLIPAAD